MSDGTEPARTIFNPTANAATAGARRPSEAATLVFAVTVAVSLGVACGVWINVRLASAASAGRAATSRPTPNTGVAEQPAPTVAAEPRFVEHDDTPPPADEANSLHGSVETADAARTELKGTTDEGRASSRAATATHAARETSPAAKADTRTAVAPDVKKRATSGGAQGRSAPCALYASAPSLTIRGGGAATLVLGGPGEAGRNTVTTPDWADIAVLYEGRTGNGWLRYTVRSVSKRPGVYTVRFATPCGSKSIPVTVTRP